MIENEYNKASFFSDPYLDLHVFLSDLYYRFYRTLIPFGFKHGKKKIKSPFKKKKKKENVIKTIMLMSLIYEVNKTILASISRLLR